MDLNAIQSELRNANLDGWLFTTITTAILLLTVC